MTTLILFLSLFLSVPAFAVDPPGKGPSMLENLTHMRVKQEEEETAIRVISQPIQIQSSSFCLPVEQSRQRIRDIGRSEKTFSGNVTVEAGHEEVSIEDNSGEIDNSVNVQIVNPGDERKCF